MLASQSVLIKEDIQSAPVVPGWGPVLGNTLQLAQHGAAFTHASREQVSPDAFEVSLAGRRMVFLFHPAAVQAFFTAPDELIAFRCLCSPTSSLACKPAAC